MVDDHPARGKLLGLGQVADGADVVAVDHVVGRVDVDRGLVVEALEVPAGLGEEDGVDPLPGLALGLLQRAVRAVARRLVVSTAPLITPRDWHSPQPMMASSRPVYSPTRTVILEVPISTAPMKVWLEFTIGGIGCGDREEEAGAAAAAGGAWVAKADRDLAAERQVDLAESRGLPGLGLAVSRMKSSRASWREEVLLGAEDRPLSPSLGADLDLAVGGQPRERDDLPGRGRAARPRASPADSRSGRGLHPGDRGEAGAPAHELDPVEPRQRGDQVRSYPKPA